MRQPDTGTVPLSHLPHTRPVTDVVVQDSHLYSTHSHISINNLPYRHVRLRDQRLRHPPGHPLSIRLILYFQIFVSQLALVFAWRAPYPNIVSQLALVQGPLL